MYRAHMRCVNNNPRRCSADVSQVVGCGGVAVTALHPSTSTRPGRTKSGCPWRAAAFSASRTGSGSSTRPAITVRLSPGRTVYVRRARACSGGAVRVTGGIITAVGYTGLAGTVTAGAVGTTMRGARTGGQMSNPSSTRAPTMTTHPAMTSPRLAWARCLLTGDPDVPDVVAVVVDEVGPKDGV